MDTRQTIQTALEAIQAALDAEVDGCDNMPDNVYEDLQIARDECTWWLAS